MTSHTTPRALSASSIIGDSVTNPSGEALGKIHELMIDLKNGKVIHAVLSVGGFLGMGDKLFAIPWDLLNLDADKKCFVLDVPKQQLERAEGFDKSSWPDFEDQGFHAKTYQYWGRPTYWA